MIEAVILFIVGLVLLLLGAEGLVRGASAIATRANISPMVIGLTVVAFGTSMPELIVAITSILTQSADIGVGNIIGSNIANIFLALGIAAIIGSLTVDRSTVKTELPFLILASLILLVMSFDTLVSRGANTIDRLDGVLLLLLFSVFIWHMYKLTTKPVSIGTKLFQLFKHRTHDYPYLMSLPMTAVGLAGLAIGATLTVDGAATLARSIGVPELTIGLVIVAVGTSLPEITTTIVAVYRRRSDLAVGNIIGSNIFNILWVLGVASLVSPLAVSDSLQLTIGIAALASVALLVALLAGKLRLGRLTGVLFLGLYAVYVVYYMTSG